MKKRVIAGKCRMGIKRNHRGYSEQRGLNVIAGDTETYKGDAWTLQLYNGSEMFFDYVNNENILDKFLEYIEKTCFVSRENIVYFHNLAFDLMILFRKFVEDIYRQGSYCKVEYKGWQFEIYSKKVNFVKMIKSKSKNHNISVHILDSMAFTQAGLDKSLKAFSIEADKLPLPKGLGKKKLKTKEFEKYAKNDVIVLYKLARKIIDMHKVFNITPSVSIAQFAMKVFRHNYIKGNDNILFPPAKCVEISEKSYHGGKNFYLYDKPKLIKNAIEIDINSSYPYACMFLPSLIKGRYIEVDEFDKNNYGVYRISGYIKSKYPILYTDDFKRIDGKFENICVSYWDIKSALEFAEKFEYKVELGYVFLDEGDYNPFQNFVKDIYAKRKQFKEQKDMNTIYKYILNSFYGKFIQVNEIQSFAYTDEKMNEPVKKYLNEFIDKSGVNLHYYYDSKLNQCVMKKTEYEAGLYYNPFIATLITSCARYNLLKLEYKYNSFHSATDSIKTEQKVNENEFSSELGKCKVVVEGRCFAFRNKLYLHFAKDFSNCNHKPDEVKYWDKGQHLCKYALHGYRGSLDDLYKNRYKLLKDRKMNYKYTKVIQLREGFKRGLPIADFVEMDEVLTL